MEIRAMGLRENACACARCRDACKVRPCWPNREEAERIEAVHPGELVVDKSCSINGLPITVMRPRQQTNGWCVFLDERERCTLHHAKLKPLEGRMSTHGLAEATERLRMYIAEDWSWRGR